MVIPTVTTNVSYTSVPLNNNWKHISNFQLADPDFGTPRNIDLIPGANVFGLAICYGWRLEPPESPSALKTGFGWALVGTIDEGRCKHCIIKVCL